MFIPSFLVECWQQIFVDNNRQQTPPSFPFACPRAKAKMLVIDQELLLWQLYFKYA
jgi:hypothetical protein